MGGLSQAVPAVVAVPPASEKPAVAAVLVAPKLSPVAAVEEREVAELIPPRERPVEEVEVRPKGAKVLISSQKHKSKRLV